MDDTTRVILELKEDLAEVKTTNCYIVKNLDELNESVKLIAQAMAEAKEANRKIDEHIANSKDSKIWRWQYLIFIIPTLISMGGLAIALFGSK